MPALMTRTPSPFPSLADNGIGSLMRSMLNDSLFGSNLSPIGSWVPSMDVAETNDAIMLTAELPGLDDKDLKLSIDNNVLTISGEKSEEATDAPPAKAYYVSERYYGAFQRSFALPRTVDVDARWARSRSTSHSGKRARISSRAIRPCRRARAAPRQKWMPNPKARLSD